MPSVNALTRATFRRAALQESGSERHLEQARKLHETYLKQYEALKKYRSKGVQTVHVKHEHRHVHVNPTIGPSSDGGEVIAGSAIPALSMTKSEVVDVQMEPLAAPVEQRTDIGDHS